MKNYLSCFLWLLLNYNCFSQASRDTLHIVIEAESSRIASDNTLDTVFQNIKKGGEPVYKFEKKVEANISIRIGAKGCTLAWPDDKSPVAYFAVKAAEPYYEVGVDNKNKGCDSLVESDLRIIYVDFNNTTPAHRVIDQKKPDLNTINPERGGGLVNQAMVNSMSQPAIRGGGSSQTDLITLDLQYGDFAFKQPKCTKYPKVGHFLKFEVVNYNPYRDSAQANIAFQDYYSNAESQFTELLKARFGTGDKKTAPVTTDSATSKRGEDPKSKSLIDGFYDDLTTLYNQLYGLPSISLDKLEVLLQQLDIALAGHFGITVVTAATIEAQGKALIQANIKENERANYLKRLLEGVAVYKKLHSYNRLVFLPVQVQDKDYTELSLTLPRGGTQKPSPIIWKNRGGDGFGYSIGAMYSPLRDYTYSLKQVPTYRKITSGDPVMVTIDTVYKDSIFRVEPGKFSIGGLILGHYYTRIPCLHLNLAATAGVGVSGQLDDYYFLGASVMLGKKRQFVLSGGGVFAKVNRLEARYAEGESLPLITGQTNAISTREVWEKDWFIAVTFQL